ncbi:glycosyltransferase family 9 protein [Candidatus Woesearchaeota archaeon]|nr:glycosyltransferase family 9 protein [Candidatus Woesearchaeota archaeon]
MKPDLMRLVDKYAGIPLCFLMSLLNSFQRLIRIRRLPKRFRPKNILFIELSEMGSTVLAYSAMKKAKELFTGNLFFLIFKENAESVKLLDIIPPEKILTIRSKNFFVLAWDTLAAIMKMRLRGIDTVVDLELFSRFTSLLSYFSGAKAVSGFYKYHMEGLYRGNFQTHRVQYNPYYHISQSFMALVYALAEDPYQQVPLLKRPITKPEITACKRLSSRQEKKKLLAKLQRLNKDISENSTIVLLNPNASQLLPIRKWPIENFKLLAKKLVQIPNTFAIITGVASEKPDAEAICSFASDARCIDFTGQTTLSELICLFNIGKALITNDSGPAHFASLTPINIFVFFGPETPELYKPLSENCTPLYSNMACSPCVSAFNHRKTPCTDNKCLQAISVEDVFERVKNCIGG